MRVVAKWLLIAMWVFSALWLASLDKVTLCHSDVYCKFLLGSSFFKLTVMPSLQQMESNAKKSNFFVVFFVTLHSRSGVNINGVNTA